MCDECLTRSASQYATADHSASGTAASHWSACDMACGLSLNLVTAMGKQGNCTIKYEAAVSRTLDNSWAVDVVYIFLFLAKQINVGRKFLKKMNRDCLLVQQRKEISKSNWVLLYYPELNWAYGDYTTSTTIWLCLHWIIFIARWNSITRGLYRG